jgi:hypothetical protein
MVVGVAEATAVEVAVVEVVVVEVVATEVVATDNCPAMGNVGVVIINH